jgi:hypothetical protein
LKEEGPNRTIDRSRAETFSAHGNLEGTPLADNTPDRGGDPVSTEVTFSDREAHAAYSNFARVTATPEEIIIDTGKEELRVSQRLVMNLFTAKRLCSALAMTMQCHEQTFGAIELDVRRRAAGATAPGTGKQP